MIIFTTVLNIDNVMNEIQIRVLFQFILTLGLALLVDAQSYAPINVTCPVVLIRNGNNGLSPSESQYISKRRETARNSLQSWLEQLKLGDFNVSEFLTNKSNVPTLALAFSGGGYRAMLNGAGVFQGIPYLINFLNLGTGLDGRVPGNGNMTGYLQANTYISGLSGGSWLVGSAAVHDFATIDTLRNDYWHLQDNLIAPAGVVNKSRYYTDIYNEVQQKHDAGFDMCVSI